MDTELRDELIRNLKTNRIRHGSGAGNAYWQSVVDTVEDFLDRHFKETK